MSRLAALAEKASSHANFHSIASNMRVAKITKNPGIGANLPLVEMEDPTVGFSFPVSLIQRGSRAVDRTGQKTAYERLCMNDAHRVVFAAEQAEASDDDHHEARIARITVSCSSTET